MQAKETLTPPPMGGKPTQADRQRERRSRMTELAFKDEPELTHYRALAAAEGYGERRFNAWLLLKLANATSGQVFEPGYVDGLRKDLENTRAALERARDDYADEREARKKAERARDRALYLLHELPGGAEAAARLLKQETGGGA